MGRALAGAFARLSRPDSGAKYEQRVSVGPSILGYDTVVVDIRRGERVRERLYVERYFGLLLRREQFDDRGRIQRSVGFRELRIDAAAPPLPRPVSTATKALHSVAAAKLRGAYSAPVVIGDGYRRTGAFRQGDVVQVVYSDGIYDLSVFEQRGRLGAKAAPPGGRPVRVDGAKGWHYTWPGGQVILWQAGRTVYTVVADAPYDDVLGAIRTVKGSRRGRPWPSGSGRPAARSSARSPTTGEVGLAAGGPGEPPFPGDAPPLAFRGAAPHSVVDAVPSAYSRQGACTGQVAQMRRATSTPTPSLGKNVDGGWSRQFPWPIQLVLIGSRPSSLPHLSTGACGEWFPVRGTEEQTIPDRRWFRSVTMDEGDGRNGAGRRSGAKPGSATWAN